MFFAPGLPPAPEADPEGQRNQAKIQPQGLFADIEEIVAELLARRDVLSDVYGGKPCEARPGAESLTKPGNIFILHRVSLLISHDLTDGQGSGAHEAHLSPKDV